MRRIALATLLVLPLLAGCTEPTVAPPAPITRHDALAEQIYNDVLGAPTVRIWTDHGPIDVALFEKWMPTTTARFLELVDAGFHNDTTFHRVIDDFVIQAGDPSGTGLLGSGQTIPLETHPYLKFGMGALGMARDVDRDSADSQWYLMDRPAPHLHDPQGATGAVFGEYAMFGQAFGLTSRTTIHTIAEQATLPGDRPQETQRIHNISRSPLVFDPLVLVQNITTDLETPVGRADAQYPLVALDNSIISMRLYFENQPSASQLDAIAIHESGLATDFAWQQTELEGGRQMDAQLHLPLAGDWQITMGDASFVMQVANRGDRATFYPGAT